MRKGIDGLATLIQDSFELDPYGDSIFLFAGWSKDRYKCLYFDGDGFAMLYKRLDNGKPIYERLKELMMAKSVLHVDETYGQIINRSDGKSGQTNAYNWVSRSVPCQGPPITLFHSALSRARSVLEGFIEGFSGTIVCDGYSAYDKLEGVTFANCWAHCRRYWLKADSKNSRIGVGYCDELYRLERKFKHLSPSKRRKNAKNTRNQL